MLAEKEAWKINEKQDRWDLVTVNPTLVIGPGINPHATSESFKLVKQFGDGTMKAGSARVGFGVVDVRDLKGVRDLGMKYRPMKESMIDFFQQMIDSGQLQPAK